MRLSQRSTSKESVQSLSSKSPAFPPPTAVCQACSRMSHETAHGLPGREDRPLQTWPRPLKAWNHASPSTDLSSSSPGLVPPSPRPPP